MSEVTGTWVTARYTGDRAKSVLLQAEAGIGYIVLENTGNKSNPDCLVAFRIIPQATQGIPEHLIEVIDPLKIREHEKKRVQRMGVETKPRYVQSASAETVNNVRNTLAKKNWQISDDRTKTVPQS